MDKLEFLSEPQIKFVLKLIRLFIFLKQDFLHEINPIRTGGVFHQA